MAEPERVQRKLTVGGIIWLDVLDAGPEFPELWQRHMICGETPRFYEVHRDGGTTRVRKSDFTFSLFGDGERAQALEHDDFVEMEREAMEARKLDDAKAKQAAHALTCLGFLGVVDLANPAGSAQGGGRGEGEVGG